jgi:phosphomannomutase/phosphoglucomutase
MSAHHYFKDFAYCDSGMIPWLLIIEILSVQQKNLTDLITDRMEKFPCSGEINFTVDDAAATIALIVQHYAHLNPEIDLTDGVSLSFTDWRFNVRSSNTEPLLRLNIECKKEGAQSIATLINNLNNLITKKYAN